jgi:hypothetical protein
MLSVVFAVMLYATVVIPSDTFTTLKFGQNILPTPVSPPPFTFDPTDGMCVCNIAGFYKFEVTTNVLIQGLGSGELFVGMIATTSAGTKRFSARSPIHSSPGTTDSGNTLIGALQMNPGDVIRVSIEHSVTPNEISFQQAQNIFIATLIQ